jgi:hypothetical protein
LPRLTTVVVVLCGDLAVRAPPAALVPLPLPRPERAVPTVPLRLPAAPRSSSSSLPPLLLLLSIQLLRPLLLSLSLSSARLARAEPLPLPAAPRSLLPLLPLLSLSLLSLSVPS